MATKRKNAKGEYVISIQSLGFNTSYSTRTDKLADANRIMRNIESRVDEVSTDGEHDWHNWTKRTQLRWLKMGLVPDSISEPLTLFEAVDQFMEHKKVNGKAPTTLYGYQLHLEAAKNFFGDIALCELTARRLQDWADQQSKSIIVIGRNIGRKTDPETVAKKLAQLKAVVKWFHGRSEPDLHPEYFEAVTVAVKEATVIDQLEKWVDFESRVQELRKLTIEPSVEGAFSNIIYSKQQLDVHLKTLEQKLFVDGSLPSIQTFCAILVCCATGARRAELTRIRRQDLLLDDAMPMVTLTKLKGRKNLPYLRQKMPLPLKALPFLNRLLLLLPESQQSLFCSGDDHLTEHGCDESQVKDRARYLSEKLTAALKATAWEHAAGWHIYRHTLASTLLMAGHSQMEVMNLIGWCSDEMARKYQHATHAHKAAMINGIFA